MERTSNKVKDSTSNELLPIFEKGVKEIKILEAYYLQPIKKQEFAEVREKVQSLRIRALYPIIARLNKTESKNEIVKVLRISRAAVQLALDIMKRERDGNDIK